MYTYADAGKEQRTFTRLPFEQQVRWSMDEEGASTGHLRNVSRAGLALETGRYISPGRVIQVTFDDVTYRREPVALTARIAWCHPATKGRSAFIAGSHVIHDEPSTLAAVSEVFYTALKNFASKAPAQDLSVPYAGPFTNPCRAS